jgi:hypothetical protein
VAAEGVKEGLEALVLPILGIVVPVVVEEQLQLQIIEVAGNLVLGADLPFVVTLGLPHDVVVP